MLKLVLLLMLLRLATALKLFHNREMGKLPRDEASLRKSVAWELLFLAVVAFVLSLTVR